MKVRGRKECILTEIVKPTVAGKDLPEGFYLSGKCWSVFFKGFIKKTYGRFDAGNEIGLSLVCEEDIVVVLLAEGKRELTQETGICPASQAQGQKSREKEHARR